MASLLWVLAKGHSECPLPTGANWVSEPVSGPNKWHRSPTGSQCHQGHSSQIPPLLFHPSSHLPRSPPEPSQPVRLPLKGAHQLAKASEKAVGIPRPSESRAQSPSPLVTSLLRAQQKGRWGGQPRQKPDRGVCEKAKAPPSPPSLFEGIHLTVSAAGGNEEEEKAGWRPSPTACSPASPGNMWLFSHRVRSRVLRSPAAAQQPAPATLLRAGTGVKSRDGWGVRPCKPSMPRWGGRRGLEKQSTWVPY